MGRQSSINKLPAEVLAALQAWLRDPAISQRDAAMRTNALLVELGMEQRISTTAVNRYSQKMEQVGEKLRQSREVAQMWIDRFGSAPGGQMGNLINEMIRTMVFELMLKLQDAELKVDDAPELAKMIRNLSQGVERLERAATENEKRAAEIRKAAQEEAAQAAEKEARKQGLSREKALEIRRQILGIE